MRYNFLFSFINCFSSIFILLSQLLLFHTIDIFSNFHFSYLRENIFRHEVFFSTTRGIFSPIYPRNFRFFFLSLFSFFSPSWDVFLHIRMLFLPRVLCLRKPFFFSKKKFLPVENFSPE